MPNIKWEGLREAIWGLVMTISWLNNDIFLLPDLVFSLTNADTLSIIGNERIIILWRGDNTLFLKWLSQHENQEYRETDGKAERQALLQPQPDMLMHKHSRGEQDNEWKRRRALTSIDISISGTQHYQSIWLNFSPSPHSLCKAAETIIEIGTFRPCMFRIPGVLPAETVID